MQSEVRELGGYRVLALIEREHRKRKERVPGKKQRWYRARYIYARIRLPDGTRRDIYLGTPGVARKRGRPRVENLSGESPESAR